MRRRALVSLLLLLSTAGCAEKPSDDEADPSPDPPATTPATTPATAPAGWQRLPDPPLSGRTGASVVGVGTRAYVFGGWEFLCPPNARCAGPTEPPLADGAFVDLATGTWQPMAGAPHGFVHASSAVVGDGIYVVSTCGGGVECTSRPELLRYDTRADTWAELGPLPARAGGQVVATDHGVLVVAGSEENGERDDVLYDPDSGRWTVLPDDPLPPSYDRFAVADGDRVLLFGSPMVEPDQDGQRKVVAAYDLVGGAWTELPPAPGQGYQVWRAGDRAFLNPHFGGAGGGVLDLRSDTWGPFPEGPDDPEWRGDLAGVVSDEGAVFEYAEGWVLDARDDEWLEVPPRGGDVYDESVGSVGQALAVFGGQEWVDDDGRLVAEAWVWRPPA